MSFGKQKEPPAELALDELHLQLIPNTLKSMLTLMQNGQWTAVGRSLDFLWGIIPPKTSNKLSVMPAPELRKVMRQAKKAAKTKLDARDDDIEQEAEIDQAEQEAGETFCYQWIRKLVDQLALDGYLFEGHTIIQTSEQRVVDQPPSSDVDRVISR